MRRLTAAITILVMVAALFGGTIQPASAQGSGTTYTVQPGDNLYRISLKFGVSMDALSQANGIVNPNLIIVGQKLTIPAGAVQLTPTSGAATVVPLGTSAVGTQPAGGASVTPGTTLDAGIISTVTSTPRPTAVPTLAPVVTLAPTSTPVPGGTGAPAAGTYTVQAGDNLYRISLKFNTTMQALMQLNNIANPNLIYVGQVLTVPASAPGAGTSGPAATAAGTQAATAAASPTNTAGNVGFSFGVVANLTGQNAPNVINSFKDLGTSWVNIPVSWKRIEATKGTLDAADLDSQIDALNGQGVKILLTVTGAPDWARSTTAESGPPTNFTDYANFVGALAARYKGKVQAYEIWYEPNIRREWNGRPLSAASYVEMLRLAYDAIKRADTGTLVVTAGLSPTGYNDGVNAINDRVFLRQAYAAGLANYSDAIGAHPMGWANPPDSTCCNASPGVSGWFNDRSFYFGDTLKDYRTIMTQNGDGGTFIWVTQFGWGSSEGVVGDPNQVDPNFGFVKFVSQLQQGQYVTRALELARTMGFIGPMFVYNLNYCQSGAQSGSSEFRGCYYSLLDTSGNPRPVYNALKTAPK